MSIINIPYDKIEYWSDKNVYKINEIPNSGIKVWFKCNKCNHDFDILIYNMNKGKWCPYCSNKRLCNDNNCNYCFNNSFASHEKSKYWSDKNNLKPRDVFKSSGKHYIFNCNDCNHEITNELNRIINQNYWCIYCSHQKLCKDDNCSYCFNNSFASHKMVKFWSKDNKDNPRDIFKFTQNKYIFNCNICNHIFNSRLSSISNDQWCPYCNKKQLCNEEDCVMCSDASFASHPKSKYWSNKNILKPREVFKVTAHKYWFDCNKCNHSFYKGISTISNHNSWCPYCSQTYLCDNNECSYCFNNSFASHPKVKYWSDKNTLNPRELFKTSITKCLFDCDNCKKTFKDTLSHIASGRWCPICRNKTEQKMYKWLNKHYINIQYQVRYDWCKNPKTNYILPFDFEFQNIIIELDGPQHFRQISNWRSPEEQNEIDKYKMKQAKDNNKHIIRINQEIVFNNINNWKDRLTDYINELLLIQEPSARYIDIDSSYFE